MKRIKVVAAGLMAVLMMSTSAVYAAPVLRDAYFNQNGVVFNGVELELSQPLVSIYRDNDPLRNYMPVRDVLEAMGFVVDFDAATGKVLVFSADQAPQTPVPPIAVFPQIFINADAIDENAIILGVVAPAGDDELEPVAGSYLLWTADFKETIDGIPLMSSPVARMQTLLSKVPGITADSQIVVYDAGAAPQAMTLVWQLRALGLDARFLRGGLGAWEGDTGDVVRLNTLDPQAGFAVPNQADDFSNFNAPFEKVLEALQNPEEWIVIDARSAAEFNGDLEATSADAVGAGRLKGAKHVVWGDLVGANSAETIEALVSAIDGRKVIAYCQGGFRSTIVWAVLAERGFEVYNFDGSWIEWSARVLEGNEGAVEWTEEWTVRPVAE